MSKAILLFSGGMDSTVLLYMALEKFDEVHCLTFDYGQRHEIELFSAGQQVLEAQKKHPDKIINIEIIDAKFIRKLSPTSSLTNDDIDTPDVNEMMGEAQPKSYVANRNMMFLSIGASYAEAIEANGLWYGAAQIDSTAGYWDGSEEFLKKINELLQLNRDHRVEVEAPLLVMSKKDIVLEGVRLKVDFSKTYTCYSGELKPDASSASSSLRLKGFIDAGLKDPLEYQQQDLLEKRYASCGCISVEEHYNNLNEKD